MTFIGMISDHKSFDKVKEELKETQLELIHINKKSIGNIKNIKLTMVGEPTQNKIKLRGL